METPITYEYLVENIKIMKISDVKTREFKMINKKIYVGEKHIICSINGNIVYKTYCDCCGKHSAIHFKKVSFLNSNQLWCVIPEALKNNKTKTITILYPYIINGEIIFK
jgi:hypothetical protein